MDSNKLPYASFSYEWTLKSTSHKLQYRTAFDISEIDEIFCTIINAKGKKIQFSELAELLGFNLHDLAEKEIFKIYLKSLEEYNLLEVNEKTIKLTLIGQEALTSKLKFKYYYALAELFENQTAKGEPLNFSFKSVFGLENNITHIKNNETLPLKDSDLEQRLQFQLFENNIYNGEIVKLLQNNQNISYRSFPLQCDVSKLDNIFKISVSQSGINKVEIEDLIGSSDNVDFKAELVRIGMFHHVLSNKDLITASDIHTYIDLWNWKELAENSKVDWSDKGIFDSFRVNGDGSVWKIISEKVPIVNIMSVIEEYADYLNWNTLTQRFQIDFIVDHIDNFRWDFEELSYRDIQVVSDLLVSRKRKYFAKWKAQLLSNTESEIIRQLCKNKGFDQPSLTEAQTDELAIMLTTRSLQEEDWDWNYLSTNLPDDFIEIYINSFPWDFSLITELKSGVLRNLLKKAGKNNMEYSKVLLSKPWNWKFISDKFEIGFLYGQISSLAAKVNWGSVLDRIFMDADISAKCLKSEPFKSLLKKHLPIDYIIADQKYFWTKELIDFFQQQNLIQWETASYIKGFDTNQHVDWGEEIFSTYQSRITTERGRFNISKNITDPSFIEDYPDFKWSWEGLSENERLINDDKFLANLLQGKFSFTDNLSWGQIISRTAHGVSFWNKHLESFLELADSEKHADFWKLLTRNEAEQYVLTNHHFPWDWKYITEQSAEETILESFDNEDLIRKWDWEIASRKLNKEILLENIEDFALFVDWRYLIKEVFTLDNELALEKDLPRLAACLSILTGEERNVIWKVLTAIYPFGTLLSYIEDTFRLDVFEWDWDYISNHKHFPTDVSTLERYKDKINWTALSESLAIQHKFNPDTWENRKACFDNIDIYFQTFKEYWDWQVLSKNRNINYDRLLLTKYRHQDWDWDYLTEFGGFLRQQKRDSDDYLEKLVLKFYKIKFEILSKRQDLTINSGLILSAADKDWDWKELSINNKAQISEELLVKTKDKSWDWKAISKRKDVVLSSEKLTLLLDKDWDWGYLSDNTNLVFDAGFIERTKSKPWNWQAISRHKSFLPTNALLVLTKDFDLDWTYLSRHETLSLTIELLTNFESNWHWHTITRNQQIDFSDIGLVERFADKWDWAFICRSGKLKLNYEGLTRFKKYLDWDLLSANSNIAFTETLIQEFSSFWNWTILKKNKHVEELLGDYVVNEISKSTVLKFIDNIEQQYSGWKGYIYHFSHIDNAVKIIRDRKIKSRSTAKQLSDSAGSVVFSRVEAHSYARFYFRPHTQTQFYNEFLGIDLNSGYKKQGDWHSWYENEYRRLAFPKCPKPIYFKFSLKEVLYQMLEKCNISTGNMQKSKTQFGKIEKMIHFFNFHDLFINPGKDTEDWKKFREFAQQEFLIEDELDFAKLNFFTIICSNPEDRNLLINLLGSDSIDIMNNIVVDSSYYRNENPVVACSRADQEISISTAKQANGFFILKSQNTDLFNIIEGDVVKRESSSLIFKSHVKFSNIENVKFSVEYVDEVNQNWLVFANYELKRSDYESRRLNVENRRSSRFQEMHYILS